jgi:hypothetical protein
MAFDFGRILRAAETLAHIAQAVTRARAPRTEVTPTEGEPPPPQDLTTGNRVFGQLEARLAGVLVSALKEAFDRDRAHLEMERDQIEHERKRTDELMRLELLRQAGDREITGIRSSITVALGVWITSVLFMMVPRGTLGVAGLILLATGWALLLGALALSFARYREVSAMLAHGAREPVDAARLAQNPLAPAVPWLIVVGLACTAASVLVRLAT